MNDTVTDEKELVTRYTEATNRIKNLAQHYEQLLRWAEGFKTLSVPYNNTVKEEESLQYDNWVKEVHARFQVLAYRLAKRQLQKIRTLLSTDYGLPLLKDEQEAITNPLYTIINKGNGTVYIEGTIHDPEVIKTLEMGCAKPEIATEPFLPGPPLKSYEDVKAKLKEVRRTFNADMLGKILAVYGAKHLRSLPKRYYDKCYRLAQYVLLSTQSAEEIKTYLDTVQLSKQSELQATNKTTDYHDFPTTWPIKDFLNVVADDTVFKLTPVQIRRLVENARVDYIHCSLFPGFGDNKFSINAVENWEHFLGCLPGDHPILKALNEFTINS